MITKRFVALLIDGGLYAIVGGTITIVCDLVFKDRSILLYCLFYPIVLMALLCKDSVGGQSIGKRKIQIIDKKEAAISPVMSILRNLSLIILPLDFIVFLITGKRIFDKIFKTDVVEENHSIKVNYKQSVIAIGLCYILLFSFFYFFLSSDSFVKLLFI